MATPFRDGRRPRRFPWATFALILANCFVFLFLQPASYQSGTGDVTEGVEYSMRWAMVPCEIVGGEPVAAAPDDCDPAQVRDLERDIADMARPGETFEMPQDKSVYLPLLTAMFLHGNTIHLLGNMLYLWVFGKNVEDRIGVPLYLAVYLLGGLAAGLTSVLRSPDSPIPHLGASGAIAAAMGAYLVLRPRARILVAVLVPFQVVYLQAAVVLVLFFVTQFFIGSDAGVAWEAHAGGMAAGVLLTLAVLPLPWVKARAAESDDGTSLRRRPKEPAPF